MQIDYLSTALSPIESEALTEQESIIERGLHTFIEVGNALLTIRDGRLYRQTHATFEDYCRERWNIARRAAYRLMDAASVVENVSHGTQMLPQNERQARELSKLDAEDQPEAWQHAIDTAPNGKMTAQHIRNVVDEYDAKADEYAASENGYDWSDEPEPAKPDSDEYYTPPDILTAARAVMRYINLDPASCDLAQTVVQADHFYTKNDNGLTKAWHGHVWLNPPFSKPKPFIDKIIDEYESGNVSQAIVLTNNGTETEWGQSLLARYPVCFVGYGGIKGSRISFWNKDPNEPQIGNRYAQMIFYLGPNFECFCAEFQQFGVVLQGTEIDNDL